MVKLIMGLKGSGKTKQMIELVKKAVAEEHGDVVCLEKGPKLTYDIPHKARLISITQYNFGSYEFLKGFISGLNASNYDVSHVFIDSLQKIVDTEQESDLEAFLNWLDRMSEKESIKFTITFSAEPSLFSEGIRKFL
ncbi:MAG: ATP-binding protein [Oscillospiraceae bacterium]|nr:ATP-binding protein [Oscillospiraceae bacterium]